jgi:hypothetical protein
MSLEKITLTYTTEKKPLVDLPVTPVQELAYSGFKKLDESNFKGGTSIKYWM